jgi:hypothetical protein
MRSSSRRSSGTDRDVRVELASLCLCVRSEQEEGAKIHTCFVLSLPFLVRDISKLARPRRRLPVYHCDWLIRRCHAHRALEPVRPSADSCVLNSQDVWIGHSSRVSGSVTHGPRPRRPGPGTAAAGDQRSERPARGGNRQYCRSQRSPRGTIARRPGLPAQCWLGLSALVLL